VADRLTMPARPTAISVLGVFRITVLPLAQKNGF